MPQVPSNLMNTPISRLALVAICPMCSAKVLSDDLITPRSVYDVTEASFVPITYL